MTISSGFQPSLLQYLHFLPPQKRAHCFSGEMNPLAFSEVLLYRPFGFLSANYRTKLWHVTWPCLVDPRYTPIKLSKDIEQQVNKLPKYVGCCLTRMYAGYFFMPFCLLFFCCCFFLFCFFKINIFKKEFQEYNLNIV